MAVFRVEKTKDYTVMANHHLKNKSLSLKAKGLLSVMLSLPENWDYTLKGLTCISKESIDAIREGVRELETAGYIVRSRSRNEKGQLAGADYVIYELPQTTSENSTQAGNTPLDSLQDQPPRQVPALEKPALGKPTLDFPTQEKPTLENPTQLNTKGVRTYPEITHTANIHPINPSKPDMMDGMDIGRCRREVRERIDYLAHIEDPQESMEQLDEIVELIVETLCSSSPTIRIAGCEYPAELVKDRFTKLTDRHIGYVTCCLRKNTTQVHNIKKYLLAALFNAPTTYDNFGLAEFNYFYNGKGALQSG